MTKICRCILTCALLGVPTSRAAAQTAIPVREVGPIRAKTGESFGSVVGLRQFSDGRVLIDDGTRLQLVLFDSVFTRLRVAADTSGRAPFNYGKTASPLIGFTRDSVLLVDTESQSLVVMGSSGTAARVIALPRAADIGLLTPSIMGTPSVDASGGLIYRARFRVTPKIPVAGQPTVTQQPDSAPLVRGNFATRQIDTLALVRIPNQATTTSTRTDAGISMKVVINPLQIGDGWAVLGDGTVAVVRSQDYHVDWILPDGRLRSTPKMPFAWRRLTDDEKQYYADSALTWLKKQLADALKTPAAGQKAGVVPELAVPPLAAIPDYLSPVAGVWSDLEGNLWVLPTTSIEAKGGKLYDVVNRSGEIIERVQIPKDRDLIGFGRGGEVFLVYRDGGNDCYVERRSVLRGKVGGG